MDPYEKEQREYAELRDSRMPPALYEAYMRLRLVASDKLPHGKHRQAKELSTVNPTKSSRMAELTRRYPRLPKPVKAGVGLAALVAALVGSALWHRRGKR